MFIKKLVRLCAKQAKQYHTSPAAYKKHENPLTRTWRILASDFKPHNKINDREGEILGTNSLIPNHFDIVIIGGAAVGSAIAYFIHEKTGRNNISIAVIEKDQTYSTCSTVLSLGGLRQQFSLSENIQMSLFGAEFMRTLKTRFGPDANVFFTPNGYLTLASDKGAQQLLDIAKLQKELGAVNQVLGKEGLKKKFPWMNVDDVELGCLGLEKEGWFDPWAFLCLLKRAALHNGANYINGRVKEFTFKERDDIQVENVENYEALDGIVVELPDGREHFIKFAVGIIAAGGDSGEVASMARIGTGNGLLSIPLPVEKRKRYVYCFECQENGPELNTPLTIDYTGAYFRREGLGGLYLSGISPELEDEPPTDNLDVDYSFFDEKVWPILANRVPAFNAIKIKNAWGGYYDYNHYDQNGIIGPHPYYHNLYMATGFSGHGIQQSPAVGRAIAELIIDGDFQTIDLTRLGFNRLIVDKPMLETWIV